MGIPRPGLFVGREWGWLREKKAGARKDSASTPTKLSQCEM